MELEENHKMNLKNDEKKIEFISVKYWQDFIDKKGKLGAGTYGKVYKVETKDKKKEKALKLIPDKTDYLNEIDHLCRLNGIKGILPLEKVYIAKNKIGLLFPLGLDFEKWWEMRKTKHENVTSFLEDILCIIKCLLESVAEMHDRGIIHRDLSLANLVFYGARPQIIDLGFSKRSFDCHTMECDYLLASPMFRAPELIDPELFLEEKSFEISKDLKLRKLTNNIITSEQPNNSTNTNSINDVENMEICAEKQSVDIIHKEQYYNDTKFVKWEKFYHRKELNKMKWIENDDKKLRVLYYNEKVDEWSLGCIFYYLLMGDTPFHDSTHNRWYQLHQHYKNYYGSWAKEDYPKVFEKLPKNTREKQFDILRDLKLKFSELGEKIINNEEGKLFKNYGNWISNIICDLLIPNANTRPSSKELLFRVFEQQSIEKSLIYSIENLNFKDLNHLESNDINENIEFSEEKSECILSILNIFYDKCVYEDCYVPIFYQTIFLWKNQFLNISDDILSEWFDSTDIILALWKSFYLSFYIVSKYFYYLSFQIKKLEKKLPVLNYNILNYKIKFFNQMKGIIPIDLPLFTNWSIEQKLWNPKREKSFHKFVTSNIKNYLKFPNQDQMYIFINK